MDRFDRVVHLHHLLSQSRYPLSMSRLVEELDCGERTVRRILAILRDRLGAPIETHPEGLGYYYDKSTTQRFELPNLWFSAEESFALLASHQLLSSIQPGLLDEYVSPLTERLESLLAHRYVGNQRLVERVLILSSGARTTPVKHFQNVAGGVLQRNKLRILYHGRDRDQTTERTVSPQRLVYYRSNWHLDAWCELRQQLRTFALDRLHLVEKLDDAAIDISEQDLKKHYESSYGIFAGEPVAVAKLRFSASAARWVADELWHENQQGKVLSDGRYEMRIPYSDHRELLGDILRYGAGVEVIEPVELREIVHKSVVDMLKLYKKEE